MALKAEWTPDCQGKQDYDAEFVSLSTRYWPRGGGFFTFDSRSRVFTGNEDFPETLPSACASIYIQDDEILSANFEAETEQEVKAAVEAWAAEKCALIERAVRATLGEGKK